MTTLQPCDHSMSGRNKGCHLPFTWGRDERTHLSLHRPRLWFQHSTREREREKEGGRERERARERGRRSLCIPDLSAYNGLVCLTQSPFGLIPLFMDQSGQKTDSPECSWPAAVSTVHFIRRGTTMATTTPPWQLLKSISSLLHWFQSWGPPHSCKNNSQVFFFFSLLDIRKWMKRCLLMCMSLVFS